MSSLKVNHDKFYSDIDSLAGSMADPPVELLAKEWGNMLTQQLEFLRQANRFCDVTISTSDGETEVDLSKYSW